MASPKTRPKKTKAKKISSTNADLKAQIKSIDRLIEREEYDQAEQKLRKILRSHGTNGGLRHRLLDVLNRREKPWAAAMEAYEWTQATPQSSVAWIALANSSHHLGLLALADQALKHCLDVGKPMPSGTMPALPEAEWLDFLNTPFGENPTKEELELLDMSQIFMQVGRYRRCIEILLPLTLVAARNNRALAHFQLGEVDISYQEFLASWQDQPRNLFALGWLVKLALWRGDTSALTVYINHLKEARAPRIYDALSQIDALLWMQENQAAWQLCQEYQNTDWYDENNPHLLVMAAACAANNDNSTIAKSLLQRALASDFCPPQAKSNLDDVTRPPAERRGQAVTLLPAALPSAWFGALSKTRVHARTNEYVDTFFEIFDPVSNLYLANLFNIGDQLVRQFVREVLQFRAKHGDENAVQSLKGLLNSRQGTMGERISLAEKLIELKFLDPSQPSRIWTGKEITEVTFFKQAISDDPLPSELPDAAHEKLTTAMALLHAGKLQQAQTEYERLLKQYPTETSIYTNLAYIYSKLGKGEKEVERLMERALAVNPDYLIGRCNLATLMLDQNRIEEAENLLKGLERREQLHTDEAFAYHVVLVQLSMKKGRYDSASRILENLKRIARNDIQQNDIERLQKRLELLRSGTPKFMDAINKLKALTRTGRIKSTESSE